MAIELDNTLWRVINACAAVLVLVCGFCSHEMYGFVRSAARVTEYTPAVVNHSLFWSLGMATLLALYVYRQTFNATQHIGWAGDRALTIWLIAAIAFLPLQLTMFFHWHVPGARRLYIGYALKAGCFLYLYWLFFRYHVFDDQDAFAKGRTLFHSKQHAVNAKPASEANTTDSPSAGDESEGYAADPEDGAGSSTVSLES